MADGRRYALGEPAVTAVTVFDIFSKRQKRLRGEVPDVYTYDAIPEPLRVQVFHIWENTLGDASQYRDSYAGYRTLSTYKFIVETLRQEYGVFALPGSTGRAENYLAELGDFLLKEKDVERVIDAVELSFRLIDRFTREYGYLQRQNGSELADEAIVELNARLREHGVGFQYVDGEIIRVDSEFIHAEAVKPALVLLRPPEYAGAQAEFLKAHEHYRHGNAKEALAECLKALESVMKAVCDKHKWAYPPQATSKALIQICFDKGLVPAFWDQHFASLRSMLESGVPTGRNRLGATGRGPV